MLQELIRINQIIKEKDLYDQIKELSSSKGANNIYVICLDIFYKNIFCDRTFYFLCGRDINFNYKY